MISIETKNIIKRKLSAYHPTLIGLFGSYARNEESQNSDIDILIDLKSKINLLELIGLEQDLSEALGKKVDLVTFRSVNPQLMSYIQKDLLLID
ncbi:MAG: nucleotidyltransferase family protein [Bacteroidota bacterium]